MAKFRITVVCEYEMTGENFRLTYEDQATMEDAAEYEQEIMNEDPANVFEMLEDREFKVTVEVISGDELPRRA